MVKQTVNRPLFDISACIHNIHAISHTGNNAKIMCNQHNRSTKPFLYALNDLEDLRLHSNVKRRSWLIGDQYFRIICDGDRDNNALAHSSGKFVWKLLGAIIRLWYPNNVEQLDSTCFCLAIGQALM